MIRLPIVITIMSLLPAVARADDASRPAVDEQGLANCNDVPVLPCFEMVWVRGVQHKMAFFDLDVQTNPPTRNFYVVAPQTGAPQGIAPFLHDHVVGDGDGTYWHGFLAVCSAEAMSSGACVTSAAQGELPLARTVNGRKLTTAERIESAARSGLIVLVDTGAVLLATIDRCDGHHDRTPD
jgi:hypothetical protein